MKSKLRNRGVQSNPARRRWRFGPRSSTFVFVASLGVWLPKAHAAALVDLDATTLPEGPLATWSNAGTVGGDFTSAGDTVPQVTTTAGVKGVSFLGGTGGAAGTHDEGPAATDAVAFGNSRTVEAWVYNPSAQAEETVFAWGRRGGPDGTNASFNHGTNADFGAVGHWGAPAIGWNGKIAFNRWFDQETATFWADADADGVPDWFENQYAPTLNPAVADGDQDPDGDGLTNRQAFENVFADAPGDALLERCWGKVSRRLCLSTTAAGRSINEHQFVGEQQDLRVLLPGIQGLKHLRRAAEIRAGIPLAG
jgi:hypothetical protein